MMTTKVYVGNRKKWDYWLRSQYRSGEYADGCALHWEDSMPLNYPHEYDGVKAGVCFVL